jgi:hypothetical protein
MSERTRRRKQAKRRATERQREEQPGLEGEVVTEEPGAAEPPVPVKPPTIGGPSTDAGGNATTRAAAPRKKPGPSRMAKAGPRRENLAARAEKDYKERELKRQKNQKLEEEQKIARRQAEELEAKHKKEYDDFFAPIIKSQLNRNSRKYFQFVITSADESGLVEANPHIRACRERFQRTLEDFTKREVWFSEGFDTGAEMFQDWDAEKKYGSWIGSRRSNRLCTMTEKLCLVFGTKRLAEKYLKALSTRPHLKVQLMKVQQGNFTRCALEITNLAWGRQEALVTSGA